MNRLPIWFKQELLNAQTLTMQRALSEFKVNTVCLHAKCPNLTQCFNRQEVTFMILGGTCTRNCRFCAVEKAKGSVLAVDSAEADRVAEAVKSLGLNYVVITSVTRDDLIDGGAGQFFRVISAVYGVNRLIKIEVLIPDFQADFLSLKNVIEANPLVIAHNLETTRCLSKQLRPEADYERSLNVLRIIKDIKPGMITKSSIMLGLGESECDVIESMQDLRSVACDILTLGQYLAPSKKHYPVQEFIKIEQFEKYKEIALNLGFKSVLSAPLARSSYKAEEVYSTACSPNNDIVGPVPRTGRKE